jgi:hypothetical protein
VQAISNPMALIAPISVPWTYVPNSLGPVIAPFSNGYSVARAAGGTATNQWTFLSLLNVQVTNGWTFGFDIKYNKIALCFSSRFSSLFHRSQFF